MVQEYRSEFIANANMRAPHRLSVWLKRDELVYHSDSDIRNDASHLLAHAFNHPDYFGYMLKLTPGEEYLAQASPAAIGTLAYIAFETRRLYNETGAKAPFKPLEVTALVESDDLARQKGRPEILTHCSGQVFDIDYSALPPAELECLRFVLNDLGWEGYLGFVDEGKDNLHIGCSPASREFFTGIFEESVGKRLADQVVGDEGAGVR